MEENKLLYFDDEPFMNSALADSLRLFGWDVTMVSEIDDFFKELRTSQFNILILDLMAPVPKKDNKYINFTAKEIDEMKNAHGTNVGVILAKKIWYELGIRKPLIFLSAKRNPIHEDTELEGINFNYLRKPQLAIAIDEKLREMLNH